MKLNHHNTNYFSKTLNILRKMSTFSTFCYENLSLITEVANLKIKHFFFCNVFRYVRTVSGDFDSYKQLDLISVSLIYCIFVQNRKTILFFTALVTVVVVAVAVVWQWID